MQVRLHKNATTTRKTRALVQASDLPMTVLAKPFGVTVETIARWKRRDSVEDRPHTAHRLQTTLSPAQEAVVLAIRETRWLSLDDASCRWRGNSSTLTSPAPLCIAC